MVSDAKDLKLYSVRQRIEEVQSLQALSGYLSIPIDTAGEPRAKRESTSVNNIQTDSSQEVRCYLPSNTHSNFPHRKRCLTASTSDTFKVSLLGDY